MSDNESLLRLQTNQILFNKDKIQNTLDSRQV